MAEFNDCKLGTKHGSNLRTNLISVLTEVTFLKKLSASLLHKELHVYNSYYNSYLLNLVSLFSRNVSFGFSVNENTSYCKN